MTHTAGWREGGKTYIPCYGGEDTITQEVVSSKECGERGAIVMGTDQGEN